MLLWASFAAAVSLSFAKTPDDTLITLRYAHNVLAGWGPVFNPGQRVNGATSPAGLAMAVVALALPGGFALFKLKVLSLVFGALTIKKAGRLLEVMGFRGPTLAVAAVAIGAGGPLAFASGTGLETTLDALAVTALLLELLSGGGRPWVAAGWAALAVVSRPEAIVVVIAVGAVEAAAKRRAPRWVLGPVAAEIAVLTANLLYYGSALPNTYYAKDAGLSLSWWPGLVYLTSALDPAHYKGFMSSVALVDLSMFAIDLMAIAGLVVACRRWRRYGMLGVAVVTQAVFALTSGGDWMQQGRFVAPVAVPLTVLVMAAAGAVAARLRPHCRPWVAYAPSLTAVVACTASMYSQPATLAPVTALASGLSDQALVAEGHYAMSPLWAAMPRLLSCAAPGQLVATTEAGYGPYADPSLRVLDLRGLMDVPIARRSAPATRNTIGVRDPRWEDPTSPVGAEIVRQRPVLIFTIDPPLRPSILGGRYHLLTHSGTYWAEYTLAGYRCAGPSSAAPGS